MTVDFNFESEAFEQPKNNMPAGVMSVSNEPNIDLSNEPDVDLAPEVAIRPVFHQSAVQHYFTCPKKYKLYLDHKEEMEDSMAMRKGLIFETYVFGHKPGADEEYFKSEIVKKITAPTLNFIKGHADFVKDLFISGEPFVKLQTETEDYIIRGEADFIGTVLYEGEPIECIADLKYTSNINELWNKKEEKKEFLQSVFYPSMLYQQTGKLLPFLYILVEGTFKEPLVKQILIKPDTTSFMWLDKKLIEITEDIFFEPRANENNCMSFKSYGKCPMMEWCEEGRELICTPWEMDFDQLRGE